jgi:HK97 family phage major capsid protein
MKTIAKLETRALSFEDMNERELTEQRNTYLAEMDEILKSAKTEKRNLTQKENGKFESIKKSVKQIDDQLKALDSNLEMRQVKGSGARNSLPLEVRGYKKSEKIGNGNNNVTIGDLIYSHITGRYRNEEVRASLSTTSGGLSVPTEVYKDFVDRLRNQSFLGETTVYPMTTQTLLIPRVTQDVLPHFKLENELITESEPLFAPVTLQAKPLYAMTSISLELIEASNLDVGQMISQILLSAMQSAMQTHMLKGAVNGYTGILNDPNINKVTATSPISYSDIGAGIQAVQMANGQANSLLIGADSLMGLQLAQDTTGQFITAPQFFQNLNVFSVGTDIGADALVGDLSSIAWGVLSEGGLQIEIDKSGEAFQRGQIKIRARINADFALTNPKLVAHIDAP